MRFKLGNVTSGRGKMNEMNDWKLRRGDLKDRMPLPFPAILGRDLSGVVVALAEGVNGLKMGDASLPW